MYSKYFLKIKLIIESQVFYKFNIFLNNGLALHRLWELPSWAALRYEPCDILLEAWWVECLYLWHVERFLSWPSSRAVK
jgi:hypothetical protein